ncbi:MAG: hypothetical protein JWP58_722 [Hymenobacter sp.]|nr:hypothetical protein [Hymenobacter sp.]
MKLILPALLPTAAPAAAQTARAPTPAANPIIRNKYKAAPSAMVQKGTVYTAGFTGTRPWSTA